MRLSVFMVIVSMIMPFTLSAQLSEMQIMGEPMLLSDEIIARQDVNGNFCAGIKVISEMDGFHYDAYNGIVGKVDDKPGEDLIYVSADERVLMVYHTGYEPLKIILQEIGIQLRPRSVWKIKISGEPKELQVTFVVTPSDAEIDVDGQKVPGAGSIGLSLGKHGVSIERIPYESIQDSIFVSEERTVFRYTMIMKDKAIRDKWGRMGNMTLVGSVLFLGGGIGFNIKARQSYEKYQDAVRVDDAVHFKKQTQDYNTYSIISSTVGSVLTVWTIYNYIKKSSIKIEEPGPSVGVEVRKDRIGLVMRF